MTRFVEIPGDATFRSEDGDMSRTYVVTVPGRGEIRIEVERDAVGRFEDCVVGRVGGVPFARESGASTHPDVDDSAEFDLWAGGPR